MPQQTSNKTVGGDVDSVPTVPQESVGSAGHSEGVCRPCVWYWRPSSCSKGQSCEYCHMCDEESVLRAKALRKASRKGNAARATSEAGDVDGHVAPPTTSPQLCDLIHKFLVTEASSNACKSTLEECTTSVGTSSRPSRSSSADSAGHCGEVRTVVTKNDRAVTQESVGSVGHTEGMCRPCVWFWRPESCSKGTECEYCHLCDEGAVDRMKAVRKASKKLNRKMNYALRSGEPAGCNLACEAQNFFEGDSCKTYPMYIPLPSDAQPLLRNSPAFLPSHVPLHDMACSQSVLQSVAYASFTA